MSVDVQLENGYVRIANDLYAAIAMAPFSAVQLQIVLALIRLSWGWQQKEIMISQVALAEHLGRSCTGGFRRAITGLVDADVIRIESPAKSHTPQRLALQKDYSRWGLFSVPVAAIERWSSRPRAQLPASGKAPSSVLPAPGRAQSNALPAPGEAFFLPPEGQEYAPLGGRKTPPISFEDNELHDPKERKERKDSVARIKNLAFRDGRLLLPPDGGAKYLHPIWTTRMGAISLKSFADILHPIVAEWGVLPTRRGMELFITERTTPGKGARLEWFVEQAIPYITRAHQIPAEYDPTIAASSSLELIEEARTAFWVTLAAQDAQETAQWEIAA